MMPETLRQYRERTAFMADSLAPCGGLRTSDGLTRKVGPDGSFRPLYGDTVIFSLEEDVIRWLEGVQGGCTTPAAPAWRSASCRRPST